MSDKCYNGNLANDIRKLEGSHKLADLVILDLEFGGYLHKLKCLTFAPHLSKSCKLLFLETNFHSNYPCNSH